MGERFREDSRDPARRWRNLLLKWLLGAACAVGAAVLVVYMIESHRLPPAQEKVPAKPVTVTIVPATRP